MTPSFLRESGRAMAAGFQTSVETYLGQILRAARGAGLGPEEAKDLQ